MNKRPTRPVRRSDTIADCPHVFNNRSELVPKRSPITLATVRQLALALPGVEEGLSYGTPGFRVRGKFLFFITDLYRGYPTVLVRLGRVTKADLRDVLEEAWRRQAPRRLVTEYDRNQK
jgi:hypothetical protein